MAEHLKIAEALDLDTYLCDPASPWQRGRNENTNGLLRQYFPKVTDGYGPTTRPMLAQSATTASADRRLETPNRSHPGTTVEPNPSLRRPRETAPSVESQVR
jgi:hypothetical protein